MTAEAEWGLRSLGLPLHLSGPPAHLLSWLLESDLQCQFGPLGICQGAHFHGREGSFSSLLAYLPSPPSLDPSLPPSLPPFLPRFLPNPFALLLRGQTATRLISYTRTTCISSSSRNPNTTKSRELPAAMLPLSLFLLGLLTTVPLASCQQGLGNLQPWMQGLIAVAVFLVLVAIVFAVNHFWCQEEPEPGNMVTTIGNKTDGVLVGMDGRYSSMASNFRSSEHNNAYENILEEEGRVRSTPM